jgi:hypothetical protein
MSATLQSAAMLPFHRRRAIAEHIHSRKLPVNPVDFLSVVIDGPGRPTFSLVPPAPCDPHERHADYFVGDLVSEPPRDKIFSLFPS